MFVKPAEGLKVPDPFLKDYLPAEGREVSDNPYWRRLLKYKNITAASRDGAAAAEPVLPSVSEDTAPEKPAAARKEKRK